MRITLDVDDDVLAAARVLAADQGITIGAALSELARVGLQPTELAENYAFPVFAVPGDAPRITADEVREASEEA